MWYAKSETYTQKCDTIIVAFQTFDMMLNIKHIHLRHDYQSFSSK